MLLTTLGALATLATAVAAGGRHKEQPNIILIITDDQDKRNTMDRKYLPKIFEHMADQGVMYDNFFAPVSLCCPSRVSLLRAQHAHNHNVTFVQRPWGGWEIFNEMGYVGHTMPDFLQKAGYDTYYVGKYMNDQTVENCQELPVSGFTDSEILVDPWTYDFWNPGFSHNSGPVKVHYGEYSTDLVANKSLAYLDRALKKKKKPFFIGMAPIGPHSWFDGTVKWDATKLKSHIPASAPRHQTLFPVETLPRPESWNPDEASGVSWVRTLPKLNDTEIMYMDDYYRGRLRSLQPIDELVEKVVQKLTDAGQLDNTYIIFTSDNGFAMGTHRRQPGKTLGFEEDINVPLIIRGPGIPKGMKDDLSTYNMVDLSRTIMELGRARTDYENDGVMINLHQGEKTKRSNDGSKVTYEYARHSISEYWVMTVEEGVFAGPNRQNNTYRTLRVHDEVDGNPLTYSYSVWCTGERELYDLNTDPYQVRNILAPLNAEGRFTPFNRSSLSTDNRRLVERLDGLLLVLKTCKGNSCRQPYHELFPSEGKLHALSQVLDAKYDDYFANLPRVQWSECILGFQSRMEKPEWDPSLAYGKKRR